MSLLRAMASTFGACVLADLASDAILHPKQKLDYGLLNPMGGKPVENKFWGTRTEHILGVASALAVTENLSKGIFRRVLKVPRFEAASHLKPYLVHTFLYILAGVALHCTADALINPTYEGENRLEILKKELRSTLFGSATAWHEPLLEIFFLRRLAGSHGAFRWIGGDLLPSFAAYLSVKIVGWQEWGGSGLYDFEKEMNASPRSAAEPSRPQPKQIHSA